MYKFADPSWGSSWRVREPPPWLPPPYGTRNVPEGSQTPPLHFGSPTPPPNCSVLDMVFHTVPDLIFAECLFIFGCQSAPTCDQKLQKCDPKRRPKMWTLKILRKRATIYTKHMFAFFVDNRLQTQNTDKQRPKMNPPKRPKCPEIRHQKS